MRTQISNVGRGQGEGKERRQNRIFEQVSNLEDRIKEATSSRQKQTIHKIIIDLFFGEYNHFNTIAGLKRHQKQPVSWQLLFSRSIKNKTK